MEEHRRPQQTGMDTPGKVKRKIKKQRGMGLIMPMRRRISKRILCTTVVVCGNSERSHSLQRVQYVSCHFIFDSVRVNVGQADMPNATRKRCRQPADAGSG